MGIENLKQQLKNISTYPDSLKKVCCEIKGIGFFPGARGLWQMEDHSLEGKSIMILGHDFGAEKDYQLSVKRGCENLQGLTWKNLVEMLNQYDVNPEDCFFTNAIMGVRTNSSAIGESPAFDHPEFLKDCKNFFIEQIKSQKPTLIIALGQHIWKYLAEFSETLNALSYIKTFSELDNKELSFVKQVKFNTIPNFTTNIAFITHPTYWHLNVKNRKYKQLVGIDAEKEIIKSCINKNHSIQNNSAHKIIKTMNTGNFIIYKNDPNEWEMSGEVPLNRKADGRLFLNVAIEFSGILIIFRDIETSKIAGVFSASIFYVLAYSDK
jgi:uracil-DNA glycosylase